MLVKKSINFQFYQSANISDCEIVKKNFVVRKKEFELIRSDLFDDQMKESVQHYLILGRRGSGKSTLLKRIECEIVNDEILKQKYIVLNFAEEQGSIHRLFDLFEEIIKTLKCLGFKNLPDTDIIDIPDDYSEYSRQLYNYIQTALHNSSKKLVLLIDNIDKIFLGIKNDAQILREILLNFDDIKIIGGSTRMSEHFWQNDLPFYQFFRIIKLEALSSDEIKKLLICWSRIHEIEEIEDFVKTKSGQIEAIRFLTDGLPRTLQFFVDLLINRPQQNGYSYIQKIMDLITPLYQERLNSLLPIEQKIVMKLAFKWEAVSIKELVKPTKIESKLLSANLKKLTDIGIVDKILTGKKNHLYRLSERFFNMWLIVTQGNPIEKRKAKWLTIFFENWYGEKEIKRITKSHLENLKVGKLSTDHLTLLTKALSQSKYTSFKERDLLIEQNLSIPTLKEDLKNTLPSTTSRITERIQNFLDEEKYNEAFEEVKNIPNEIDGVKDFFFGEICRFEGSFEKAEEYYLKAIEKGDEDSLNNLAYLYYTQKKYDLSEEYCLKAIEKGDEDSLFNLALLYNSQKKYDLSEEYYLKAIKIGHEDAFNNLANLYHTQKKYNLSEDYYLKAIEKGNEKALYNLALLYDTQKQYDLSEEYYLKAIEKGDEKALNNLAILYETQKKYELSEEYYLKAIEKGNEKALTNLAFLYYIDLKNQKKLESIFKQWDEDSIDKKQFQVLSNLWKGEVIGVYQAVAVLAKEKGGLDEMFITHLLVHYQKNLVWKLFNEPEYGTQLKNKFAPLFYATSKLVNNEESKLNLLRIPPEILETVQDILSKIEELRKEYYPEN